MLSLRKFVLIALTVLAVGAAWPAPTLAQGDPSGIVTVFDHDQIEAAFAKALASGGGDLLWGHMSGNATYTVSAHSRESVKAACKPEGCSHKGFTAVVYVVSGAATLVVGGTAKVSGADRFGGQSIAGGESHRISKGDIYIVPPDTVHWYRDVETPFHYIEIPVH